MKRSAYWDLEAVISHDLFETISIGMIVMSEMGHYLVVNPAFCRMLGYSKKELTGRSFRDVTHPDDWKISP